MKLRKLLKFTFTKHLLMDAAGSLYETVTFQNFTQRLIRRKAGNLVRRLKGQQPLSSWQDGRVNYPRFEPSAKERKRLNDQAARSI